MDGGMGALEECGLCVNRGVTGGEDERDTLGEMQNNGQAITQASRDQDSTWTYSDRECTS